MSQIPIPSHELPLDLWLVLVLLGLSPAMLGSWLETRFRTFVARLPIDGYGVVLLTLATGTFLGLGTPPRFLSSTVPLGATVFIGLLAGVAAVVIDYSVARLWKTPERKHREAPRRAPQVPADVPTGGEVVWRLRDSASARRNGLASLLVPAVLEEVVYRQALLVLLSQAGGVAAAAVVSTLSFGAIHISFGVHAVVSKLIIGGIFVAIVLSGGGLLSVVLAHSVLNATVYFVRMRRTRPVPVLGLRGMRA